MTERDHWLPQRSGVSDPHQPLGRRGNAEVWLEGRREAGGEGSGLANRDHAGCEPRAQTSHSLATETAGGLWSKSLGTGSRIPGGQEEREHWEGQTVRVSTCPGDSVRQDRHADV